MSDKNMRYKFCVSLTESEIREMIEYKNVLPHGCIHLVDRVIEWYNEVYGTNYQTDDKY